MAVVIHYYAPHIGGMEQVARCQVSSLAVRGHPVTVVTCAHAPGLAPVSEGAGWLVRRSRALNFLETRLGITFPIVGPGMLRALWQEIGRADIVHIHDVFYLSSHLAFLVALLRRRRFVLTQHVALVDHPSRLVMAVQQVVYATVGRVMFRRAERIVTYNARVRDFVAVHGAEPSRVVMNHNGIDTGFFSPVGPAARSELRARYGLPQDKPVVLFVGRLVPKKGYDLVIDAADPGHTTLIVGEGAGRPNTERDGVVMFGPASPEQLRDLYRLSDVFVFPAVGELFTLVMQEAMASGLPVVTTDDPAYAEYGLDRSLIGFCARRSGDVRRAVADVIGSPERRKAMAEYSRRLSLERFSWDTNYEQEYVSSYPQAVRVPDPGPAWTRGGQDDRRAG